MNEAAQGLFGAAGEALACHSVTEKVDRVQALQTAWSGGELLRLATDPLHPVSEPGRPPQPQLVHPRQLRRRSLHTDAGRVALIHAIAHIEFNAINLALDAVHRFRDMPAGYYGDWLTVAYEEARHFGLLRQRLADLGHRYGDLPAHDGLWDMACRTAFDVLPRMALVPRVLEARGLDVTPGMIDKLGAVGDEETVAVLRVILREEVRHVAIGSHWFHYLCRQRGLDSAVTFRQLLNRYFAGELRGPFNHRARLQAGFTAAELRQLEAGGAASGRGPGS